MFLCGIIPVPVLSMFQYFLCCVCVNTSALFHLTSIDLEQEQVASPLFEQAPLREFDPAVAQLELEREGQARRHAGVDSSGLRSSRAAAQMLLLCSTGSWSLQEVEEVEEDQGGGQQPGMSTTAQRGPGTPLFTWR